MSQPSFSCPRCGYETFLPSDIAAGYCPSCWWWTGDSMLGSEDVMAQNAIDGPLSIVPVSESTRASVEADWFAATAPMDRARIRRDLLEAVCQSFDVPPEIVEQTASGTAPTYRVARFVRALRRFRR